MPYTSRYMCGGLGVLHMCRYARVIQVYILHMYNMCVTYISATHVIHMYFYTSNLTKNTTHILQV